MAQKVITGYTYPQAAPHISADDEAQLHRGLFDASGILAADGLLGLTVVDNNTVRLKSGLYANQGYLVCVPSGQAEDLTVISGSQGAWRKDLVIAQFTRGGGDVSDEHIFTVLTGSDAGSQGNAADPALAQEDLSTGGVFRQEALYRLTLYGLQIVTVERLCRVIAPYGQMPLVPLAMTSGVIPLTTNRIYKVGLTGAATFSFPSPTPGMQDQILLYLTLSGAASVTWPAGCTYVASVPPTLRSGKYYRVVIEYDVNAGAWCVGAIESGAA